MDEIIPYYKPLGLTPLQAIQKLKTKRSELAEVPITYAGRLDPMAEGLLVLLVGETVKRKQEFLDLPKTYEARILLGFNSDTFDILGLANLNSQSFQTKSIEEIIAAIDNMVGTHQFPYPIYSSKTVNGKPLWLLARDGEISEENLPTREMTVLSADNIEVENIAWSDIYSQIPESISLVNGDFRQEAILKQWVGINDLIDDKSQTNFQVISIKFVVSSGTYIRTLAHELGKALGGGAILLHLKRTSIGDYKI